MRLAFHAPMKPPDHPVPSGDRRMARLLMEALRRAGHDPELACRLVTRDAAGDPERQARMIALGGRLAGRLTKRYRQRPPEARPRLWFTYHSYYKAPDLIGPAAAKALGIPYVVAEVSLAEKRREGPWGLYHRALVDSLDAAAAAVTINPLDAGALPAGLRQLAVPPFLESADYPPLPEARRTLESELGLPGEEPWLLAVGMFRGGDKLESYRLLARALESLTGRPWRLLIVGDGPARAQVEDALSPLPQERLCWLGRREGAALKALYAAADLMVWPAHREAYGMALLEAQASGLPVVAGREGGVPAVVADGESGLLTAPGDPRAFAAAVASLLDDPKRRQACATAARRRVARDHDIAGAASALDGLLRELAP